MFSLGFFLLRDFQVKFEKNKKLCVFIGFFNLLFYFRINLKKKLCFFHWVFFLRLFQIKFEKTMFFSFFSILIHPFKNPFNNISNGSSPRVFTKLQNFFWNIIASSSSTFHSLCCFSSFNSMIHSSF